MIFNQLPLINQFNTMGTAACNTIIIIIKVFLLWLLETLENRIIVFNFFNVNLSI